MFRSARTLSLSRSHFSPSFFSFILTKWWGHEELYCTARYLGINLLVISFDNKGNKKKKKVSFILEFSNISILFHRLPNLQGK
jgi:hypothetical protein